ncbi:alkyl hydroperoxide reductase [Nocardiopsis gilva YIM 90087]|uniref:Alkyl hydroperoxide reductase n=1 Tax=Nocardiopsis gilva YIM 90087 TaxID=1235441 RepID=A0A223S135_9ACTN|nr:peroxiredoxin family protein [Nocardiopsis gilva]ASU81830.1 alkyl hydroperoxide reductase [Nocardiopsis gilva YIM 90087]
MSANRTARPRSAALRGASTKQQASRQRRRTLLVLGAALAAVVLIAGGVYLLKPGPESSEGGQAAGEMTVHGTDKYPYLVGEPGAGEQAPDFTLPATTGEDVSLSDYRGQSVLLYFQEGVMCQPCFDQITALEKQADDLEKAGIDQVLSISTDPVEVSAQKSRDMGLSTPTLADPDLTVSRNYDTNSYGMMGGSHNGHSFLLISPEGEIRWRADYGGKPKYVMFLPVDQLLADMRADLKEGA